MDIGNIQSYRFYHIFDYTGTITCMLQFPIILSNGIGFSVSSLPVSVGAETMTASSSWRWGALPRLGPENYGCRWRTLL